MACTTLTTILTSSDLRKLCDGQTVMHTDPDGITRLYMSSRTYHKISKSKEPDWEEETSFSEDLLKMIDDATDAQRMFAMEYMLEKFKTNFGIRTGTKMINIYEGDEHEMH